ncbi:MAG: UDP-N-acetylmuramoyl-L-alanyl-D-glutamate--2,6-diaminopimelate ligase [Clostridia bacterium]|nr:UDP-N-acetylmuramoyl-L-alanyl-D-glutamate--2,6-diaminopimelate ligase [Clostridia bacterium]MBQ9598357.1 UDP-N-acetylmuramoyl-L-alanyl-D-glutamate--2,6-diaminopimelate ligase [Clostridia bacterium]
MKLSDVLKGLDYTLTGNDADITSIEYDSRRVKAGSLFVAIKGFQTDGHLYIDKAIENGASAILFEEGEAKQGGSFAKCADTRIGLSIAAANFYENSASRLKIIGVTGTNGKTTTTTLIKNILELKGYKTGLIGTNQNMIGDEVIKTERTTPESCDLHALFNEMEAKGVTHVVMEVSSHALVLNRTHGINFEVGVFTNLTQDHLDFHKTMEEYCKAKAILFSQSKKGVINIDDKWGKSIIKNSGCPAITYGIDAEADLKAENVKMSEKGVIFDAVYNGEVQNIKLGIPGKFSVYNALSAIGACLQLGIGFEEIAKGLVLAKGVKGRAEIVPLPAGYTVLIDYAHTPDGLENIINTVQDFASGDVITVFGCGGDRDKTKRPKMGAIAGKLSDYVIVTSDNPRTEDPDAIIKDILEGMTEFTNYEVEPDRTKAIGRALKIAKDNDVIILAGKGHETYQILKDKTIDFDERKILRELFESMN